MAPKSTASADTTEPSVESNATPEAESIDRTGRRVRLPALRRGRVFDNAPFDQAEAPNMPTRRVRLPVRPRARALETVAFDPNSSHTIETPAHQPDWQITPTHRLEGFELRSVASAALHYYACAAAVVAVAVALLWAGLSVLGIVGQVEGFMRSIGFRGFRFAGFEVITGGILLGVAVVAFFTAMTVLAAAFFNLLGHHRRGVGVRLAPISSSAATDPTSSQNGNGNGNGKANAKANGNGNGNGNGKANGNGNGKASGKANGYD